jgi:hypothetical protein
MLRKIFTLYEVDKEDDNTGDNVVEADVGEGSIQYP